MKQQQKQQQAIFVSMAQKLQPHLGTPLGSGKITISSPFFSFPNSWRHWRKYAYCFHSAFSVSANMVAVARLIIIVTLLAGFDIVDSNPLPLQKHQGRLSEASGASGLYYKSGNPPLNALPAGFPSNGSTNSNYNKEESQASSDQQEEPPLVKPSQLTFRLNRHCEADVSLERVTCRNLRFRSDLPSSEKYFAGIQRGQFVNISGNGNIQLQDIQNLFPNLIVLEITQSRYSAASLINLESTRHSSQWESRMSEALKSNNKNGDGNNNPVLSKLFAAGSRGQRALISQGEQKNVVTFPQKLGDNPAGSSGESVVLGEQSPDYIETNEILLPDTSADKKSNDYDESDLVNDDKNIQMDDSHWPDTAQKRCRLNWPSIRQLNLSSNELISEALPDCFVTIFPNLEQLDLSKNKLSNLDKMREANWDRLKALDISDNQFLDCTTLEFLQTAKLLRLNETLCDQPPHANKPKPISDVLPLVRKMREECLVNCSCEIAYIWELNNIVHAQTVVNCSGRGFYDFPDPAHLPKPVYTLDLRNNSITSLSSFVEGDRYSNISVMNLYLDDNQITSINILEGSEWFYSMCQVFSIQRNNLTEVPVYVLENLLRQNKRLYKIDLSYNKFKCDCSTVSTFKVWLLKYTEYIQNVDHVRCSSTNEQIRYMKMEDWCKVDNGTELIDVLDLVSIILATLIIAVIAKVYYDYWNFRTKGKLPWIVSKM